MYLYFMMVARDTKNQIEGKNDGDFTPQAQQQVKEILSQDDFETSCMDAGGICVIGLFDPQVQEHETHIEILQEVADKRARDPLRFLWLDATKQPQFVDAFQISMSQFPTVVAYSPKKERFGTLFATYTEQHVGELLDGVMRGSVATTSVVSKPTIIQGGAKTQSEQMEEVEMEEEFDLSDIMSEEIEGVKSKEQVLEEIDQKIAEEQQKQQEQKSLKGKKEKSRWK
eukprot:TRINITY_DN10338_c1_g1_i1.p1 TRINITY_DN10338_c1_g1~~TRINITY_DN10338_c1_g1_i1.p1  ORF type:complete len:245 (+),score=58.98 TRINITY_DN10338_c1_g1_i1:55-735(+)